MPDWQGTQNSNMLPATQCITDYTKHKLKPYFKMYV